MERERLMKGILLILGTCLLGCSQNNSGGEGSFANGPASNGPASNSNIHMMDQQASDEGVFASLPVSVKMPESSGSNSVAATTAADISAASDDKGVGPFTSIHLTALNKIMASKGNLLFQSNCAACHALTGDRIVGPGLKGVTEIRTPEWILNMMTNPSGMTGADPVARALLQQYAVQMAVSITNKQAREILEFLRANDGAR